jgi:hypothetical protein
MRCRRVPHVLKKPIPPVPSKIVQVYGVTTLYEASTGNSNFNRPTVQYRIRFRFLLGIHFPWRSPHRIVGLVRRVAYLTSHKSIHYHLLFKCPIASKEKKHPPFKKWVSRSPPSIVSSRTNQTIAQSVQYWQSYVYVASKVHFEGIFGSHGQSLAPDIPQPISVCGPCEVKYILHFVNITFFHLGRFFDSRVSIQDCATV